MKKLLQESITSLPLEILLGNSAYDKGLKIALNITILLDKNTE
jgi:hypothetical protein